MSDIYEVNTSLTFWISFCHHELAASPFLYSEKINPCMQTYCIWDFWNSILIIIVGRLLTRPLHTFGQKAIAIPRDSPPVQPKPKAQGRMRHAHQATTLGRPLPLVPWPIEDGSGQDVWKRRLKAAMPGAAGPAFRERHGFHGDIDSFSTPLEGSTYDRPFFYLATPTTYACLPRALGFVYAPYDVNAARTYMIDDAVVFARCGRVIRVSCGVDAVDGHRAAIGLRKFNV
jgi:hypothetical protein